MILIPTTTQHENSVTVVRDTGTRVDFVYQDNEIILGETTGESHTQIVLTPQEAIAFAEHIIISVVSA
jgi:hypothetical protein